LKKLHYFTIPALLLVFLSGIAAVLADSPLENVLSKEKVIRLATTTSTENSGLLHYLLPSFENKSGYKVHVIAVGTGKALRMGKTGMLMSF